MEYPKLTPRLICEEVSSLSDIRLIKRPCNKFRPDTSPWWLVPSTDILYYKYCFLLDKDSEKISLKNSKRSSYTLKPHNIKTRQDLISAINELNKDQWL